MSDSEAETANNAIDNDNIPDDVPKLDPELWKNMAIVGAELGAAVADPVPDDGAGDIDLDHLNDNFQDGFDDNLSLEVNFGDGSSCRASDVSSLSFQNIVLDDGDNAESDPNMDIVFRHRGSISESSDSPLNDFPCDDDDDDDDDNEAVRFSGRLEEELKRMEPSGDGSRVHPDSPDEFDYESDSTNTGTMKRRNKLSFCTSATSDIPATNLPAPSSNLSCPPTHQLCGEGTGCCSPTTNHFQHLANNNRYLAAFQDKSCDGRASGPVASAHLPSGSAERDALGSRDSAETPSDAGDTTPTASETLHSNSSNGNQSDTSLDATTTNGGADGGGVQKRNSLEIRNNIPNTKEVKKYGNDHCDDRPKLQSAGAVPKIRKKSPGLARRLADSVQINTQDRDSSSSERESEPAQIDTTVHSAQKDFELKLKHTKTPITEEEHGTSPGESKNENLTNGKSDSFEKLCDSLLGNDSQNYAPSSDCNTSPEDGEQFEGQTKGMEIENEYDYIKYARIQHGDSYVGMRLAYSTSNDSLSAKRNNWNGGIRPPDEEYLGSSYEGSPEKLSLRQPRITGQIHMSKVNEDTLTEIPLNGSDHLGADDKNFSLSPEATECDSAEVESVISEEGKSSTSGMPIVEDGLSSSQGSDAEDVSMHDAQEQTPSEILKRRYKAEIDQGMQATESSPSESVHDETGADNSVSAQSTPSHTSGTSCTSTLENHRNKEVDMAIKDIKSAIERSKQAARQRAAQAGDDPNNQEPVWVMR
ncbi:hypothetical protein LSH36_295g02012 [Paralvinella palmiformis]|uniref:Uncharacterized protein n=1 Tax=Paralvinella palmiformis TaxID=53620 RepID=A0AAD9JHW8_9ANNE|nr:hypothetical protein LSH36_295g02012 [Paralvinella palmiformis]